MSLPPALLKRLASRGLVKGGSTTTPAIECKSEEVVENEEIIAEDYDELEYPSQYDTYEPARRTEENFWIERMRLRIAETNVSGYKGCPNKYNIYHKCNVYCVTRWGNGITEPDKEYSKRRLRLLKKYPLPKGWKEIYDSGCGCNYYWNTANNSVSWLPPLHPRAVVSKSAAVLRRQLEEISNFHPDDGPDLKSDNHGNSDQEDSDRADSPLHYLSKNQSSGRAKNDLPSHPIVIKKHRNRNLDKTMRQREIKRHREKEASLRREKSRSPRDTKPSKESGDNSA